MVDAERAEGEQHVAQLSRPVQEAAEVAAGRPVAEGQLDLLDGQPASESVERHPRLTAEAGRARKAPAAGSGRQRALSRERLAQLAPGGESQQLAGGPLDDPEPAALPLGERRDREIGLALEQWAEVAREVGVAEEQAPGRCSPLAERQRLALAAAREAHDPRTGGFCGRRSPVARAVVGHDHLRLGEVAPQRGDRRADAFLLVAGGDEDGQRLIHPVGGERDLRQDAVLRGLPHAVLPGRRAAEQQHERQPAGLRVEIVDRRELLLREGDHRRWAALAPFDADRGHPVRAEPGVEAGEEAGGSSGLRYRGQGDDDPVGRRSVVPRAFLDEIVREQLPEDAVPAGNELLAQAAPELRDPLLGRERTRAGRLAERRAERSGIDR